MAVLNWNCTAYDVRMYDRENVHIVSLYWVDMSSHLYILRLTFGVVNYSPLMADDTKLQYFL